MYLVERYGFSISAQSVFRSFLSMSFMIPLFFKLTLLVPLLDIFLPHIAQLE